MIEVADGKTYTVTHRRKGTFTLAVESQNDTWITGRIVNGTAQALMDENARRAGNTIKVRRCLLDVATPCEF